MQLVRAQKGAGLIGWLTVLALIGFFALLAVRIVPIYTESWAIESVAESLGNDTNLRGASPQEIRTLLMRRLQVNNVSRIKREHIKIEQTGEGNKVLIEYEARTPLMGNLAAVADFSFDTVVSR